MKNSLIIILCLMLVVCVNDNNIGRGKSTNPVNEELKQEATNIFSNKLIEGRSHYSSNDLVYKIRSEDLTLGNFKNLKENIMPENGWLYYGRIEQAYIFCKVQRQLEIIPPQVLVGNEILGEGDIGKQLNDKWNIFFRNTINGTLNKCYLKDK